MTVQDFLGIPYRLNGRDRNGTDCIGLVWLYLRHLGHNPPDGDGRPVDEGWRKEAPERMAAWLETHTTRTDDPREGDLVLMRLLGGVMHMGVMVDGERFLHILEDRPSMLSRLRTSRRRVVGIYRLNPEWRGPVQNG